METREVKDAKFDGKKIYYKGHAKATYMSDGRSVEDAINSVGDGGDIDLSDYATKTELEGKVDKVDGKQLSTEDFTTALKNKLSGLNNYDDTAINQAVQSLQTQLNTLVSGNANDAINSFNEIIAFLDGIKDNQDLSSIIASIEQQIASKMDKVTLASVATSGSYNDLKDKPTIPSAVTESTVSGWGFTKNTGTYSKPSTGIPKSDLASAVQTSLGKADTALQSYTEKYKGTVTSVKINGATKTPDTNGMVDLGTIEGGGGSSSGEDIRYFTNFTVEQFIDGCEHENTISYETSELFNAIRNNKVICVPYEGYDRGFLVASYRGMESSDYIEVFLQVDSIQYKAYRGDSYELNGSFPSREGTKVVEIDGGVQVAVPVYDNTIYTITGVADYIIVVPNELVSKGSAIRFITGNNTTLELVGEVKWANGSMPTIEPNTYYELSLVFLDDCIYAILTPFF